MKRWAYGGGLAAASLAVGLALAFGVDLLLRVVRPWLYGIPAYPFYVGSQSFFGPRSFTAWLAGGWTMVLALPLLAARGFGLRPWFRLGLAALAALFFALLALMLLSPRPTVSLDGSGTTVPIPWDGVLGLTLGLAAAGLGAVGRLRLPPGAGRAARWALPAAVLGLLAAGVPTLQDLWRWYQPQDFPELSLEFVAARPVWRDELPSAGAEYVQYGGGRFQLDRRDVLRLTQDDLGRVLWDETAPDGPTLLVRFRFGLEGTLARRSERRASQYGQYDSDALFVNGKLLLVAPYRGVLADGRFSLTGGRNPEPARRLYRALTGEAAPP